MAAHKRRGGLPLGFLLVLLPQVVIDQLITAAFNLKTNESTFKVILLNKEISTAILK